MFEIDSPLFKLVKKRAQFEYTTDFDDDILISMNACRIVMEEAGIEYSPQEDTEKLYPLYGALLSIHVICDMDIDTINDNITNDILRYTHLLISAFERAKAQ